MEVRICARCLVNGDTQKFSITISNDKSVWELKKLLEPKLSVAACDLTVVHYKNRLLDDKRTLSSLYVQEGDCFTVEFTTTCNIEVLVPVLRSMKAFLTTVRDAYEADPLCPAEETFVEFLDCYKDVYASFETCSYQMFIPWNNPTSLANRHYFRQEGGLDMLSTIYKFTRKRFKVPEQQLVVDEDAMVNILNYNQNYLEYMSLLTLWNYSEVKEDRRMVLQQIGLEMFVQSLVREPSDETIEHDEVYHVNEAAVGCLAQFVEMSDILQIIVENLEAVNKLLRLSSHSTSLYHKEVAANTLFCCSNHPKAALQLVKHKTHLLVMEKMQPLMAASEDNQSDIGNDLSVAVQYFLCLFLANIRTLPREDILSDEEKSGIDEVMDKFLTLHSPSEIGMYEAHHSYVWITLAPFVEIAFSGTDLAAFESPRTSKDWQLYSFSSAGRIGLFSLCHLIKTKENQELFRKEKLLDFLICIFWFAKKCEDITSLVPELNGFEQIEPPKLQSIAKAYLAKCYGHKIISYV